MKPLRMWVETMNSREGARKPAQKNQQAPGRLEVLRAFLNTWRIPNDTRVATDHLREDEDVRSFRDAHFGPDIAAEPKEEVVRLREDLRNHLGKGDRGVSQPVAGKISCDGLHPERTGALQGGREPLRRIAGFGRGGRLRGQVGAVQGLSGLSLGFL